MRAVTCKTNISHVPSMFADPSVFGSIGVSYYVRAKYAKTAENWNVTAHGKGCHVTMTKKMCEGSYKSFWLLLRASTAAFLTNSLNVA